MRRARGNIMLRLERTTSSFLNGSSTCMRKLTHRASAPVGSCSPWSTYWTTAIDTDVARVHRTQLATGSGALRRPLRRVYHPVCGAGRAAYAGRSVRSWGGTTRPSTHTGWEDVGVRYRLTRAGVRLVSLPSVTARHLGIGSPSTENCRAGFEAGARMAVFAEIHGPWRSRGSGAGC